ncbi:MAG: HNH endonuclease family protein, partial [SAR324 cluster bacterium]|nr:HNH endonuclease family protein [SAR324 cluster bacterium]
MRQLILLLLSMAIATIVLADSNCPKYDRKSYRHWVDEDHDCQNARHEVLIEESLSTVGFKSSKDCIVASGSWDDPYSGRTITDATKLDIDHMVPLKEAHQSGAAFWSRERKRAYANDLDDPDTLIAVDRRLNRQKGAKDPAEWLPPNPAYQVEYAKAWVAVKLKWGLTADRQELVALRKLLGNQVELPLEAPEMNCTAIGQSSQLTLPSA